MIRTADGKKMSKSMGDKAIDPLAIIGKYGNDALRLAMVIGNTPGNDLKLNENDIRGYGKFGNKIWNASRFVLENIPPNGLQEMTENDRKVCEEFGSLISDVTSDMENYRFYLAAEKIYHYFWHTFADIIIEGCKKRIREDREAESAKNLLYYLLLEQLKLLHPFMPFITEKVWSLLPDSKSLLMVEKWPS